MEKRFLNILMTMLLAVTMLMAPATGLRAIAYAEGSQGPQVTSGETGEADGAKSGGQEVTDGESGEDPALTDGSSENDESGDQSGDGGQGGADDENGGSGDENTDGAKNGGRR